MNAVVCSFCCKNSTQVEHMLLGHKNAAICDQCVDVATNFIKEKSAAEIEYQSWVPNIRSAIKESS